MKATHLIPTFLLAANLVIPFATLRAAETVTVDNFVRAETDMTLDRYVKQGAFGKFMHIRMPTPIDKQDVIRMNRDTLYSIGVFDLDAGPVTIMKPDAKGRFQSMLVINQDHSMLPIEHGAGEFTFTREKIGTRYVITIFRTFVDPTNPDDVRAANAQQDKLVAKQKSAGSFKIPEWDEATLHKVRDAINVLAATRTDTSPYFGDKSKLNPLYHLLGTAYGWGGNPPEGAVYDNVVPDKNDGNPGNLPIQNELTNRTRYSWLVSLPVTCKTEYVFHQWLGSQDQGALDGGTAYWYGIDQYLYHTINDCWQAGVRFEWFRDEDGTRVGLNRPSNPNKVPFVGSFYSLTAGVNWTPTNNLTLRPEIRYDWFNGDQPVKPYNDGVDASQLMLAIDAILMF